MGFSDLIPSIDAAVFDHLGDAGTWDGAPVRLMLEERDEEETVSDGPGVVRKVRLLKVRRSEVPNPASGQIATLGDGLAAAVRTFRVLGQPQLEDDGTIWLCEAVEL